MSLYAAKYFANIFGEASDYEKALREKSGTLLAQVKETLSNVGVAENRIRLRMTGASKKDKIFDKILVELKTGGYDTVIVGNIIWQGPRSSSSGVSVSVW